VHPFEDRFPAYLLLEDGRRFEGTSFGAQGSALGEVVFNTAMTGYQEVLTDPSYSGQLVAMTYPLIGNCGINDEDSESPGGPKVAGFIVREAARRASSWRARVGLSEYLSDYGIVGITGVDTRTLTRHIRDRGAMRAGIALSSVEESVLLGRIKGHPKMEGRDLASGVSTRERYVVPAEGDERFHVLSYDFGVKAHSPKLLSEKGCRVTVIPADTPLDAVLSEDPDGLFVSNGPVFGICLGHQLIARAFGASTFKLPFGHHGANHPVRALDQNHVEITSQNHGFAVEVDEEGRISGAPELRVTHVNLYDGTLEGLEHEERPVFSVQYHPESAPGPHDSRYLFDHFIGLMEARSKRV
jgi:carbamoyl-phosphate synthase small subunit